MASVVAANQISKQLDLDFGGCSTVIEPFCANVQMRLGGDLACVIANLEPLEPLLQEAQLFSKI